jgi:DNA-directed RNA polymerase subunit RPC12/RpoP
MSFIPFRQRCDDCGEEWNAAFGIVGTMQIAAPPEKCHKCGSKNLTKVADGWKFRSADPWEGDKKMGWATEDKQTTEEARILLVETRMAYVRLKAKIETIVHAEKRQAMLKSLGYDSEWWKTLDEIERQLNR